MQSDWPRAFWLISQEQDFSQIQDLCRNTANNKHFHQRTNSVKLMINFFFKLKNLLFAHFPNFRSKKSFSKRLGCHAQFHKSFQHHSKIRKINDAIPRKRQGRWKERRTEGQTDPISQVPSGYHQGSKRKHSKTYTNFQSSIVNLKHLGLIFFQEVITCQNS